MDRKIFAGALAAGMCATLLTAPASGQAQDRVSATEKGSVLIFSKVELRWDASGKLKQDTFIDIANDYPADVSVKMYFINGDRRIPASGGTIIEPGWNWLDNVIELTANEPTFWSCATGLPKGVSPFTALDPGIIPGRPDPDSATGERHLRGYIIAWAVNPTGDCEIKWNHLKGDACIVNYAENSAWEYNAWAFSTGASFVNLNNGANLEACGQLLFNGNKYDLAYDQLLMDFYAVGSSALSGPSSLVTVDTDLTLHPLTADLRQETEGPASVKASFDIWNQNEVKFTGTDRCITCWDQTLLSNYYFTTFGSGANISPNHFFLSNLQTDKGRARIDGLQSNVVCPAPTVVPTPSQPDPLLGVVAKHLSFDGYVAARAGTNLHGLGTQSDGIIRYDLQFTPNENASGTMWLDTISKEVNKAAAKPRSKR